MPRLLATQGPLKGRSYALGDLSLIGRDPACTVPLSESTASRRHVEIRRHEGKVRVRDLGSHNGTFVNGRKVEEAELASGDTLTVGDHSFLFLTDEAQASTVASPGSRRFQLDSAVSDFEMLGESPGFKACLADAERLAKADAPILVIGETGTGKELMTRWIHGASHRSRGPFVAVNSAAIPESLFESELFGAESGAFTGATARRPGKFELASGGTLFLDEIGELPLELQPKLLRAVQEKRFYRVGGTKEIRADARIIAATNRDLAQRAKEGRFREDLYHRLNGLVLEVPSLRDRREDIPLLARHVAERTARRMGRPFEGFSDEALARLTAYPWPGNIRELQNVVERAVVLATKPLLGPDAFHLAAAPAAGPSGDFTLAKAEEAAIRRALERSGGKRGEAAKLLGISWPTLRRKIKLYSLE